MAQVAAVAQLQPLVQKHQYAKGIEEKKKKKKKKKNLHQNIEPLEFPGGLTVKEMALSLCGLDHCCGAGSVPGLRTSECCICCQIKQANKKTNSNQPLTISL